MRSVFEQVEEFNKTVLGIEKRPIGPCDGEEVKLSSIQLQEEIGEFQSAWVAGNVGEMADAMVDLIYFACGIAYKQGIPYIAMEQLFNDVHNANMKKAAGKKAAREYDGDAVDAFKPEGWTAPDAEAIVNRWNVEQVYVDVIKCTGEFCKGDLLLTCRYPDGRYMLLDGQAWHTWPFGQVDEHEYSGEDILVWEPDDSIEHFHINDSEFFRLA